MPVLSVSRINKTYTCQSHRPRGRFCRILQINEEYKLEAVRQKRKRIAKSRFDLDETGFLSCGRGHHTGRQMLVTSAESGYLPSIDLALQHYNEGELKLTTEKAAE